MTEEERIGRLKNKWDGQEQLRIKHEMHAREEQEQLELQPKQEDECKEGTKREQIELQRDREALERKKQDQRTLQRELEDQQKLALVRCNKLALEREQEEESVNHERQKELREGGEIAKPIAGTICQFKVKHDEKEFEPELALIVELVSFPDGIIDSILLEAFREHWSDLESLFDRPQRFELLCALRTQQKSHKLTLSHINDILSMVGELMDRGFSIVCSKDLFSYKQLKKCWLKTRIIRKDCDTGTVDDLIEALTDLPWNCLMLEHFLFHIEDVCNQTGIRELLTMIVKECINFSTTMTIVAKRTEGENCVQNWIKETKYYLLLNSIHKLSPSITQIVDEKLGRFVQITHSGFKCFIEENISLLKQNLSSFASVLERIHTYQIPESEWDDLLAALKEDKNPSNWVKQFDQKILSHIFGDSDEYKLDDLIQQIHQDNPDVIYAQKENLKKAYALVNKVYNSKLYSLSDFSDFVKKSHSFAKSNDEVQQNIQKRISEWKKSTIRLWAGFAKSNPNAAAQEEVNAVIKRAVELCHKFSPRTVQLLSLLLLANPDKDCGRLAQINTGEGKSLIVAMLAALHALKGLQVDVVTTSTELSIREVKKQRPFFELLNITVDENSTERDKKSVYKCDIVYGTASDFQGDILRTEFLGNDIRRNRKHQVIIVDEVDSMLFDGRSHSVRLADECPGMNHLEVPLAFIWYYIHYLNNHMISLQGKVYLIADDFEVLPGKKIQLCSGGDWEDCSIVVEDKIKFIKECTEESLRTFLRTLEGEEQKEYGAYQDLNLQLLLKEEELAKNENDRNVENEIKKLSEDFKKLAWNKRNPIIDIPQHLRPFALKQVPGWVRNAMLAEWSYKRNEHYTVIDGRIVPINYNETGELQTNMIWSDGLAQFLQIKEGLRVDPEGLSTNFISNVGFFQRYGSDIFGLTGTLGEESTQKFLHVMYGTDMVVIPPFKHTKIRNNPKSKYRCKELAPLVLPNQEKWKTSIKENALYHAREQRAVLVICKFIRQVEELSRELSEVHDVDKIFTYTGAEGRFEKQTIDSGEIVLATNIAGRGMDLKTSENVEKHGGMCVLVTFLPESFRVEMQNVGRTARGGKRGMAQLIVLDHSVTSIETLKQLRHEQETRATAKAVDDARKMLIQDRIFRRFCRLENSVLPSSDEAKRTREWSQIKDSWTKYSSNKLDPQKIAEKTTTWSEETSSEYYKTALAELTDEDRSNLNVEDFKSLRESAEQQVAVEASDFSKQYQQQVMKAFISKNSKKFSSDLLEMLENGQTPPVSNKELAQRKNWTNHERKGLEETFGLWLKGVNFDDFNVTEEQALAEFETGFEKPFQPRVEKDELIRNHFYYVLKGNDMLDIGNFDEALNCYTDAIKMEPMFSGNAHYNMAQALLSYAENKGSRQRRALEALSEAKRKINNAPKQNALTFNTLASQHSSKEGTSQHVKHQIDILGKQNDFIDSARQVIKTAQSNGNNVKITSHSLSEIFSGFNEDHEKTIRVANRNGLNKLFTVEEKKPTPWMEIISVALFGIAQIAVGCVIAVYTKGVIGVGLISEGIADLITATRSAISGSFSFAAWATQKAVSLSTSLVCSGVDTVKQKIRENRINTVSSKGQVDLATVGGVTSNLKGSHRTDSGKDLEGLYMVAKEIGFAVGKGVIKDCFNDASKYSKDQQFVKDLENEIAGIVSDILTRALSSNELVQKAFEADNRKESNYWKEKFVKHGKDLLKDKEINKCIEQFKNIATVVSSGAIPYTGDIMELRGGQKCLNELRVYMEKFTKRFNDKVAQHKKQINDMDNQQHHTHRSSASLKHTEQSTARYVSQGPILNCDNAEIETQKIYNDTSYSVSTPKILANEMKRSIMSKVSGTLHEHFVNPATTKATPHVANDLFKAMEESVGRLRKEFKTQCDTRKITQAIANAPEHSTNQLTELGPYTQLVIAQICSGDHLHDTTSLIASSSVIQAPIHVYGKNNTLKYIAGRQQPNKPIRLKHCNNPSPGNPLGHFTPLDSKKAEVTVSGRNTSGAIDSVLTQLSFAQRESLQLKSAADLRKRIIDQILEDPQQAEALFEKQARLRQIIPDGKIFGE